MQVGRDHACQALTRPTVRHRLLTVWLSSLYSTPVRWSIKLQRRLIMHPSFTDHMSETRMRQFQHEAMAMQRVNLTKSNADNTTSSSSLTRILWYVFFGLHIPDSNQKQGETYTLPSFQARLNASMWKIACITLGLGLLIGSFINSNFGSLPIVLLSGIILVAVSLPILTRSASMLSKHTHIPYHR